MNDPSALAAMRREYSLLHLRRRNLNPDPLAQFQSWLNDAIGIRRPARLRRHLISLYKFFLSHPSAPPIDINAATLATVDEQGVPSARVVLVKNVDARGFVFYTSYNSRKGRELESNPNAALVFYWPHLERQVNVAGIVSRVPAAESDDYFRQRPFDSRLASWVAGQSTVVPDRAHLEKQLDEVRRRFNTGDIPRPDSWGGYLLAPERMEFWQGRPGRFHDRFQYVKQPGGVWVIERLAP